MGGGGTGGEEVRSGWEGRKTRRGERKDMRVEKEIGGEREVDRREEQKRRGRGEYGRRWGESGEER